MKTAVNCRTCGLVQRLDELKPRSQAQCCRCGSLIMTYKHNSLSRTAAFSLAAIILYIPANIYPILRMSYHGAYSESTVWDGCVNLFKDGQWFVAVIVFVSSMAIPLFKLLTLVFLVVTARTKSPLWRRERTQLYKVIDVIGPWAMLDVFLMAILVALVKLQQIATVMPGRGLIAFTAVVVLTILASTSFDPKLIWNEPGEVS